jgi:hypothetical protein
MLKVMTVNRVGARVALPDGANGDGADGPPPQLSMAPAIELQAQTMNAARITGTAANWLPTWSIRQNVCSPSTHADELVG